MENYNPNSKNVQVLISENAYLSLLRNSLKYRVSTGNLAGFKKNNLIVIGKAKHFVGTNKLNEDISFKNEDYVKLMTWEEKLYNNDPPHYIVGWYKIWKGDFIPRGYDITTQMGKQGLNPEAFMIILNPDQITNVDPGLRIIRFKDLTDPRDVELEYLDFKVVFIEKNRKMSYIDILNNYQVKVEI